MQRAEIMNVTRGEVLHAAPVWARTAWQQARGFMWSVPGDRAIIFPFLPARRVALHMWFVFGPIDVVALDGKGMVVAIAERFRPWSWWRAPCAVSAIIELPAGTVARTATAVGDRVALPAFTIRERGRQT